ncbi:MAG: type II toxin-antitoxin system VapC family toxin [Thermomicrobiales bacterium]
MAVKWILQEELSDRARALYRTNLRAGVSIVAPSLLLFEATNIIRQKMRGERAISLVAARRALEDFLAFDIEIHSPPGVHQLALNIADAYGLPAAYDAHYLALSDLLGCEFWTADRRLLQRVQGALPFVRWLGDYVPPSEG